VYDQWFRKLRAAAGELAETQEPADALKDWLRHVATQITETSPNRNDPPDQLGHFFTPLRRPDGTAPAARRPLGCRAARQSPA
jgi:hypothetical protein